MKTSIKTISILCLLIFKTLAIQSGQFLFSTYQPYQGTNIEYPKEKHGEKNRGEDSIGTSPKALVVCDGVGGSAISSKFISSFLTDKFLMFMNEFFKDDNKVFSSNEDFKTQSLSSLKNTIDEYSSFLASIVSEWKDITLKSFNLEKNENQKKIKSGEIDMILKNNKVSSSSTFVSIVLESTKTSFKYRVLQKGDSLVVIFRLFESKLNKHLYYKPIYMTKDLQHEFNCPYQFTSDPEDFDTNIFSDELKAEKFDIMIIGSDGVFDNLHLGLMTMMVNSAVNSEAKTMTKVSEELIEKFQNYVELYISILADKAWVVRRYFANSIDTSLSDENNNTGPPQVSKNLFDFLLSTFKKNQSTDKTILKGSKNDFALKLEELLKMIKVNDKEDKIEKSAYRRFFSCPVVDMLSMPKNFGVRNDLLSPCVVQVLETYFNFPEEHVKEYIVKYNSYFLSQLIATTTDRLSKATRNYPSPFYIHAWQAKKALREVGSGKRDDIGVISAMVSYNEVDYPECNENLIQNYALNFESTKEEMKKDIFSYLNFHYNQMFQKHDEINYKNEENGNISGQGILKGESDISKEEVVDNDELLLKTIEKSDLPEDKIVLSSKSFEKIGKDELESKSMLSLSGEKRKKYMSSSVDKKNIVKSDTNDLIIVGKRFNFDIKLFLSGKSINKKVPKKETKEKNKKSQEVQNDETIKKSQKVQKDETMEKNKSRSRSVERKPVLKI